MSRRRWPDVLVDYGTQLYVPWRVGGRNPYRDIHCLYGPLSMYVNASLFALFASFRRSPPTSRCSPRSSRCLRAPRGHRRPARGVRGVRGPAPCSASPSTSASQLRLCEPLRTSDARYGARVRGDGRAVAVRAESRVRLAVAAGSRSARLARAARGRGASGM
jgi:hypothetical protein